MQNTTITNILDGNLKPAAKVAAQQVVNVEYSTSQLLERFIEMLDRKIQSTVEIKDSFKPTRDQQRTYIQLILEARLNKVNNVKVDYIFNNISMPAFIEYCTSLIGTVFVKDLNLKFVPVISGQLAEDIDRAKESLPEEATVNQFIREMSDFFYLVKDYLSVVTGPIKRDPYGDESFMQSVIIQDTVRAITQLKTPTHIYATAALNAKLEKEEAMTILYRVTYDDVAYLIDTLPNQVIGGKHA